MNNLISTKPAPHRWGRYLLPMLALLTTPAFAHAQQTGTIAGFGSSVCDGYGDHLNQGGYIGRLESLLADKGWRVVDVSRGGDNTASILQRWEPAPTPPDTPVEPDRYLMPHQPGYVLIGLSLGNEGIKTIDPQHREDVFNKFHDGMLKLIHRCRAEGMQPVVVNCYARSDFEQADYDVTRRMNLLISTWDVPSVNVLGAIDDGYGRWAPGFFHDPWHPSGGGYDEMFLAIVPTLFDAMRAGKPIPVYARDGGYARIERTAAASLNFRPEHPVHAFSTVFTFRCDGDGLLSTVTGRDCQLETTAERFGPSSRVLPTDQRFNTSVSISDGALIYRSANGSVVRSPRVVSDGRWHQVAITHRAAAGQTLVYLDASHVSTVNERLMPDTFELGGHATFDARDWFVYRSALSAYDVAALADGTMVQSSLEVYAPLRDERFTLGKAVENRAQSLSEAVVQNEDIRSGAEKTTDPVP